jgi:hypothetical protein
MRALPLVFDKGVVYTRCVDWRYLFSCVLVFGAVLIRGRLHLHVQEFIGRDGDCPGGVFVWLDMFGF